jgi:hypothetical protein
MTEFILEASPKAKKVKVLEANSLTEVLQALKITALKQSLIIVVSDPLRSLVI